MNKKEKIIPHEVIWDHEKSSRIWEYYSFSIAHQQKYFSKRCGHEVARLLSRKLLPKVESILDYSCGHGDLIAASIPYLGPRHKISACDVSSTSVEMTTKRFSKMPFFSEAIVVETFPSPLSSNYFDLIIATEVIEHLNSEELGNVLTEMARTIKQGGYIFVTTPYKEDLVTEKTMCPECGCIFHRWQHQQSWSPEKIMSAFSHFGFQPVECRNIQWGSWLVKLYCWMARLEGNGIYYIGKKF